MPTVRSATDRDLPAVGRALAAAFADDPVWEWIAPPTSRWSELAANWFRAEAASRIRGDGEVLVDDDVRGAAMWAPPSKWEPTIGAGLRILVPSVRLFRQRTVRAVRLEASLARAHPRDEHWYLAILGTDPAHQGSGVGGALIRAVTDRCDDQGLAAYLESSKERNVSFYARHGFEVTERFQHRDGPPLWLMRREART